MAQQKKAKSVSLAEVRRLSQTIESYCDKIRTIRVNALDDYYSVYKFLERAPMEGNGQAVAGELNKLCQHMLTLREELEASKIGVPSPAHAYFT